jgi:glycosyltransferase involved in cell wall biosynthesis
MPPTSTIIGNDHTTLQVISASAVRPSSFVLREVRELCQQGLSMFIGQLRPALRKMNTTGFHDLDSWIVKPRLISLELFIAVMYYARRYPGLLVGYIALVFRSRPSPSNLIKMLYVFLASLTLAYKCRDLQIAHVRAHFLHTEALGAYFASGLLQVPYSLTVHTVAVHYPPKIIGDILEDASFIIADTEQVVEFLQTLGVTRERIRLLRNGVPIDELDFQYKQVASPSPIILAAGYLSPKKGFGDLITACGFLRDWKLQFKCVLIGDGSERKKLMKFRKQLGLENEVEMIGDVSIDILRSWYHKATIFVMPSLIPSDGSTDGLPTVVIEALACGTPVIGTNTAGIPEIIVDGQTGLLVPASNPNLLADRIRLLLSHETLRKFLSFEGRRLVERDFDLHHNCEILANLLLQHSCFLRET